MATTPPSEYPEDGQAMDIQQSPIAREYPARPQNSLPHHAELESALSHGNKFSKFGFGKKNSKWGLGMFGNNNEKSHHQNNGLAVVEEGTVTASNSTPSLKRTKSSSTDKSVRDIPINSDVFVDKTKVNRKEAEKLRREAELQRRRLAEKTQREQARAVMQKRQMLTRSNNNFVDLEWNSTANNQTGPPNLADGSSKGKEASTGPIRQSQLGASMSTVSAAAGRFALQDNAVLDWHRESERLAKRRREFDDDQSSSDVHSIGHMSTISFATVDSDPGPSLSMRKTPSSLGMNRMTSTSSLRTSFDDFGSTRSSNSFSLDGQLANDFRLRAAVDSYNGTVSPPPMSPSSSWVHQDNLSTRRKQQPPFLSMPNKLGNVNSAGSDGLYDHLSPSSTNSAIINPIFKVVRTGRYLLRDHHID